MTNRGDFSLILFQILIMVTGAFVYFMTNKYNNVLYIGVTNDLVRRIAEHKAHINKGFTDKYNCDKLVYYEDCERIDYAIEREKTLKKWRRKWKDDLVCSMNPNWNDLSESIGLSEELIEGIKEHYRLERGE